jgi:hypothetical protein
MASAAILGATGGLASAQTTLTANPTQGQFAAPYGAGPAPNNNNNSWGIANTPSGSAAAGPNSTVRGPNVNAVPAPGTVVVRFNGLVSIEMLANFTSTDKSVNAAGAPTGYKVNPIGENEYARIYTGFDGLAANGLRYGASIEVRENYISGTFPGYPNGNTAPSTTAAASSASTNSVGESLYFRRAFGYVASDQVGILRIGQGDGVISLFDPGIFTGQNIDFEGGPFNGSDIQGSSVTGALSIPFAFSTLAGAEYDNSKLVYLSPQYYGFDFGVQYAPNMGNSDQTQGSGVSASQAGPQAINLTSGNDPTRWFNQVGVGLRYQQVFGAVDVKGYGFYETAGKEQLTTAAYQPLSTPLASRSTALLRYDNLSWYEFGLAVTTMNLTLAADYVGGADNGQITMRPTGGAPMSGTIVSLTYVNGPLRFGPEAEMITSQGAAQLVGISQRREFGAGFGIGYALAPGLAVTGEYLYQYRHQGNYNFALGAAGSGTADAKSNSAMFGIAFTW